MKHLESSNLWLSVIVIAGVLLGVAMGAYISNPSVDSSVQANYDQCQTQTVVVEEGSCADGTWSRWNLTDIPVYDSTVRRLVEPHSRIFVGSFGTRTTTYSNCGGGQAEGSVTMPIGGTICSVEQQDLVDPETDVTTINESPDCDGPECDIPPTF